MYTHRMILQHLLTVITVSAVDYVLKKPMRSVFSFFDLRIEIILTYSSPGYPSQFTQLFPGRFLLTLISVPAYFPRCVSV